MKQRFLMTSPLGDMLVHIEDNALTGLYFAGQKYCPPLDGVAHAAPDAGLPRLARRIEDELAAYFAGDLKRFSIALRPAGTPFQQRVWEQLCAIPYGGLDSYGRIAQRLGLPAGSARAVGAANGRNPISVIVPCHRVIAGTGNLTGYAGGLARKQALLELESGRRPDDARRMSHGIPYQPDLLDRTFVF
jgi:methylated-DNA-[protein]-cysteine S-methyltransferase